MSLIGNPPDRNCGDMSPLTKETRPSVLLPSEACALARRMKRKGHAVEQIAEELGTSAAAVLQALAPMRMPNTEASRATLNVTKVSHEFVMAELRGGEPVWKATGRLLTELVMLRAEVLALRAMKGGGNR